MRHGKILGSSPNLYRNNPKNVDPKHCQVHAEIAAMKKAGWPSRVTVYVARVTGRGLKTGMSRPCDMCYNVLMEHKVKRVYYTN